jgi:hypothetical protein
MTYKISTNQSWGQTKYQLAREFTIWHVTDWEVSEPRGAKFTGWNQEEEDRQVDLRYKKDGKEVVLSMKDQARAVDNIRVLYLAIKSIRLNELRGIDKVLKSAYMQLEAPDSFDPYQVLGALKGLDREVYEAIYRTMAKKYHPDTKETGSAEMTLKLNKAIDMIRKELSK